MEWLSYSSSHTLFKEKAVKKDIIKIGAARSVRAAPVMWSRLAPHFGVERVEVFSFVSPREVVEDQVKDHYASDHDSERAQPHENLSSRLGGKCPHEEKHEGAVCRVSQRTEELHCVHNSLPP